MMAEGLSLTGRVLERLTVNRLTIWEAIWTKMSRPTIGRLILTPTAHFIPLPTRILICTPSVALQVMEIVVRMMGKVQNARQTRRPIATMHEHHAICDICCVELSY